MRIYIKFFFLIFFFLSSHLEEKGKISGCTCNCSDLDMESGSLDQCSPKYHRNRRADQEKSRILLKKRKKEKPRDVYVRKYPDTCVKKSSKVKEKRKKHKSKRKSLRTKDLDDGKVNEIIFFA